MISPHILHEGLGGAIGSTVDTFQQRLYFTEFDGKISRLNLLPSSATTIATGNNVTLQGTHLFDFDTGTHSETGGGGSASFDVWWQQQTSVNRQMTPRNGAQLTYFGLVNFNSISFSDLAAATYSETPITANNNSSNLLVPGAVFGVRTSEGNYTKVQILSYGYNLQIRFRTYRLSAPYAVLGTGYTQPEDIVLSQDRQHLFVTERSGQLLKVAINQADRSQASLVSAGLTAPHQISLFENYGLAYVVEFASSGRLLRINLNDGSQTTVADGLAQAIGLLITSDQRFAYVTEQASNSLIRIDLLANIRTTLVSGLNNPFFLTWADEGESAIFLTERDPANRIRIIDIDTAAPSVRLVANGLPNRPSSCALARPNQLIICSDNAISRLHLDEAVISPSGPNFLGIGFVPASHIVNGYANTSDLSDYHFRVVDAPFGGGLQLMFNHEKMYALGAPYYRFFVDGQRQDAPFSTLIWQASLGRFVSQARTPLGAGFFRTKSPGQLWYSPFHGYTLRTDGLPNGLHTLRLELYSSPLSSATPISHQEVAVMIDNNWPSASIHQILHHHDINGVEAVGSCGIVTENSDRFQFNIHAADAENHLKSWQLTALWGDNQSAVVDADSYSPSGGSPLWVVAPSQVVPSSPWAASVPGDPSSRRCAHTFRLHVWDRVINGYSYIHKSVYHKSITLLLP